MSDCKVKKHKKRRRFDLLPEAEREVISKMLPLDFATFIYDQDSIPLAFRKCELKYNIQMKQVREIVRAANLIEFVKMNVRSRHNTAKALFLTQHTRNAKGKKILS